VPQGVGVAVAVRYVAPNKATTDVQRQACAPTRSQTSHRRCAQRCLGGLVDSLRLVGSEPEGRALLRAYKLDAAQGAERAPMPFKR
jgi:hypothetical protein